MERAQDYRHVLRELKERIFTKAFLCIEGSSKAWRLRRCNTKWGKQLHPHLVLCTRSMLFFFIYSFQTYNFDPTSYASIFYGSSDNDTSRRGTGWSYNYEVASILVNHPIGLRCNIFMHRHLVHRRVCALNLFLRSFTAHHSVCSDNHNILYLPKKQTKNMCQRRLTKTSYSNQQIIILLHRRKILWNILTPSIFSRWDQSFFKRAIIREINNYCQLEGLQTFLLNFKLRSSNNHPVAFPKWTKIQTNFQWICRRVAIYSGNKLSIFFERFKLSIKFWNNREIYFVDLFLIWQHFRAFPANISELSKL